MAVGKVAKIASALAAGSGLYGGFIGVSAPAKQPDNLAEAQNSASGWTFTKRMARDSIFGAADDIAGILLLRSKWFRTRYPAYEKLADFGAHALMVGGTGAMGAIMGHDYMNWVAARDYLARHDDLSRSQQMIPDARFGAIDGFKKGSMAAAQRTQMTGIASPAASGIFYRMQHNPYADTLNRVITEPDQRRAQDPRARALGFSYASGTIAHLLTMRMGFAKAAMWGLGAGIAGGLYGIKTANNPDLGLNMRALGDVALGASPTPIMAGGLFALASAKGRLKMVGSLTSKMLDRATGIAGKVGSGLNTVSARADYAVASGSVRGHEFLRAHGASLNKKDFEAWRDAGGVGNFNPHGGRFEAFGNAIDNTSGVMTGAISLFRDNVAKAWAETGAQKSTWERSLGVGHLLVSTPHHALVAASAVGLVNEHRSKSKATSTMPSNRSFVA